MTVTTPKLGLPKVQGPDNSRDYLKGAISGGGLWRALEILDNAILSTGSITLDNATLNDPTIVGWTNAQHNHSSAATAGSTLGPATTLSTPTLQTPAVSGAMTFGGDATLQRTGAGLLQVGGTTSARLDLMAGATSGAASLVFGKAGANPLRWGWQVPDDATNSPLTLLDWGLTGTGFAERARWTHEGTLTLSPAAGQSALAMLTGGGATIWYLAPLAAGLQVIQSAVGPRAQISPQGTLTLTPDAGQPSVTTSPGLNLVLAAGGSSNVVVDPPGNFFAPNRDNAIGNGVGSLRWTAVYAVAGAINTSSREAKQDITPLDPAAALAAVLNTDPVVFDYKPPERDATYYELPDDPEQAEAVLYQRLTSSPLEEAARHQAGFVLQDATGQYQTDPLFETGEGQSNAANSVGVILAAIHALSSRLDALEGA